MLSVEEVRGQGPHQPEPPLSHAALSGLGGSVPSPMHPPPTGVTLSTVSLVWSPPERKDVGSAHRWSMTQPHGGKGRRA